MLPATIWMNMPSFYQSDLFASLAASGGVDLEVVFAGPLAVERLRLGWEPYTEEQQGVPLMRERRPQPSEEQISSRGYRSRALNGDAPVWNAVRLAFAQRKRLHVVNGIWAEPAFAAALCVLMATHARYAIYSEAPNPYRPRARWKHAGQTSFGKRVVRRSTGLLPVGRFGESFFISLGARPEQIYPFGYFRSAPRSPLVRRTEPDQGTFCELIFAGQLIERKGIDLLLEAMACLPHERDGLSLVIAGDGNWRGYLQDKAAVQGLSNLVHFTGVIPSSEILARIAQADMLVLPSRWDGWGLVVNEALMAGVPVLVSDRCGAADLVGNGRNGYVFRSEDVLDLQNKLREFLSHRQAWGQLRAEAANTGARISAERAGAYLIECMKHMAGKTGVRPVPPWRDAGRAA
jgi:glycosyltransferase involved in cell wall biosynthesis